MRDLQAQSDPDPWIEACKIYPAFDSDPVTALVFDSSSVLSFGSGLAFGYDPGPILDSTLYSDFNSDSTTKHSYDLNNAGR
ncbi:hypothetical protein EVAR_31975_1 [Eumeta japonica]|uniref:Uncharacterized protein n=1 Tax=Eumeta variegata TaxID=151549 RepID=A0A4C1VRD6_EUMVA|nr:hypothetical protein EVAR_31975_1 [Eumeta japonica]